MSQKVGTSRIMKYRDAKRHRKVLYRALLHAQLISLCTTRHRNYTANIQVLLISRERSIGSENGTRAF